MQDLNDDIEPDLQSVFKKISESLKNINQETSESPCVIKSSLFDRGIFAEDKPSSKETIGCDVSEQTSVPHKGEHSQMNGDKLSDDIKISDCSVEKSDLIESCILLANTTEDNFQSGEKSDINLLNNECTERNLTEVEELNDQNANSNQQNSGDTKLVDELDDIDFDNFEVDDKNISDHIPEEYEDILLESPEPEIFPSEESTSEKNLLENKQIEDTLGTLNIETDDKGEDLEINLDQTVECIANEISEEKIQNVSQNDSVERQDNIISEGQDNIISEGQDNIISEEHDNIISEEQDNIISEEQDIIISDGQDNIISEGQDNIISEGQDNIISEGLDNIMSEEQDNIISEGQDNVISEETQLEEIPEILEKLSSTVSPSTSEAVIEKPLSTEESFLVEEKSNDNEEIVILDDEINHEQNIEENEKINNICEDEQMVESEIIGLPKNDTTSVIGSTDLSEKEEIVLPTEEHEVSLTETPENIAVENQVNDSTDITATNLDIAESENIPSIEKVVDTEEILKKDTENQSIDVDNTTEEAAEVKENEILESVQYSNEPESVTETLTEAKANLEIEKDEIHAVNEPVAEDINTPFSKEKEENDKEIIQETLEIEKIKEKIDSDEVTIIEIDDNDEVDDGITLNEEDKKETTVSIDVIEIKETSETESIEKMHTESSESNHGDQQLENMQMEVDGEEVKISEESKSEKNLDQQPEEETEIISKDENKIKNGEFSTSLDKPDVADEDSHASTSLLCKEVVTFKEPMIIDLDDSDDDNVETTTKKPVVEEEKYELMEIDDDGENDVNTNTEQQVNNDANLEKENEKTENDDNKTSENNESVSIIIDLDDDEDEVDTNVSQNKILPSNEEEKTSNDNEIVQYEQTKSPEENSLKEADKNLESLSLETKSTAVESTDVQPLEQQSHVDVAVEPDDIEMENETIDQIEEKENAFYNKECVNFQCPKTSSKYYISPIFILNFYRITVKQNCLQYVCNDCFDVAAEKYLEWCNLLEDHQPVLLSKIPQKTNEYVEILDSSDEEDNAAKAANETEEFDEATIKMLDEELEDALENVFNRTKINEQLTWSKEILENRIKKIGEDSSWIQESLSELQKNIDNMHSALYQCPKIEMKILAPLDLNSGKQFVLGESSQSNEYTVPPIGEIERPPIEIGGEYFAAKNKVMASWLPSVVLEIVDSPLMEKFGNMKYYKVKFFKLKVPTFKTVPAKNLAYTDVPKVQLSIGTRVIALFDASTLYKTKENRSPDIKSAFYPGVIAEALQPYNNYRYLIFFDDGYTQYVHHRDVRLICEVSTNVWDDIHPGSREFIQNYLINYKKNRPMVQVKKGQSMVTELNGKWIYAKVIDVDASLIQMMFEGQKNHTEWIYRGSTRLGPLYKAIQKTNSPSPQISRLPRRSEPFVRYMDDEENINKQSPIQLPPQPPPPRSQVARKSTQHTKVQEPMNEINTMTVAGTTVKHLNNSTIFVDDEEPKGTLIYYSSKSENNPPPKHFRPHMCGPNCITREHFEGHYGVLSKPLLNSWERAIYKIKNKKTCVVYRAPCGRNLRNIEEVHRYLRITRNELNVENFVFDPDVGCLNEYQVKKCIVNKSDITEGRERIPIQCVNYYDHTMPPDCEYAADRIPTEGVNLNLDPNFLVGCDCKDDCTDKTKCSCWQLTLEGARYGNPHTPIDNIGYHYKRLLEPVTTGIYECNSRCKCSSKCINRVVQHPLETKLQVFKTSNRGWGLRCINDVPKGAFICIYAGNLLTESKANECGDSDEYFAELDYIEVAERLKEGYESDAQEDLESDEYSPEKDSDEEFTSRASIAEGLVNTRNRTASAKRSNSNNNTNGTNDDDDEQERQAINFVPNTQMDNMEDITQKYKSMRRLFGKNEYCYIMDAKYIGNVGRYFNHSCSPNLFVQNVFVDTHDLRFPWVAFFALSNIRAGTELTWNYNYEVGVVPGKVLFCQCGASNCRGRLL